MGYEGVVEVFFVIDNDGYVKKIMPNGGNVILQEEATRIINNLPRMIPGIDNNKKINSSYSISITFKLE
jgi:outer membrane biosynthesis protein TonB